MLFGCNIQEEIDFQNLRIILRAFLFLLHLTLLSLYYILGAFGEQNSQFKETLTAWEKSRRQQEIFEIIWKPV